MSPLLNPLVKLPIEALLEQRILILDGAMGTMIQRYKLTEARPHSRNYSRSKGQSGEYVKCQLRQ